MSNVYVDKSKIDLLANAIADKSGEDLTLTLDEMVEAVDSIQVGGGITPTGNIDITQAGTTDVTNYATATVPTGSIAISTTGNFETINGTRYFRFLADAGINSDNEMGTEGYISDHTIVSGYNDYSIVPSGTSVTPTESAQTIGGIRRVMEGAVTVNAIPSNYVGSGVPSADPWLEITTTFSGSGNNRTWTATPKVLVDVAEGDTAGFMADGYEKSGTDPLRFNTVPSNTTITPSTSSQTVGGANYMMEGAVTVNAVPNAEIEDLALSNAGEFETQNGVRKWKNRAHLGIETAGYIPMGDTFGDYVYFNAVPSNTTITPTESSQAIGGAKYMMEGAVTVAAMPTGTAGTPTATKGTVNNHSVSVTPAVTNTTGYITGGTLTGTAVTVSASELVSGSSSITANASGIDVTNLSTVDVNVAGGAATLQTKTKAYTPSTKQQTEAITYDEGYDGLDTVNVTVDAMATGQALPPATLIGNGVLSFDTNKVILSQNFMTSAIVTSGYISSATTALTSVSLSATMSTRSEADLTASGSVVTAKSGYYSASASKAVAAGTAGTPTASKGTVTNNAVSVTPKVTNTTGYITGGTLTGTAVTVSASELVSGTSTLTQNTTYDVTNLSSVTVNVPTSGGGFQGYFLSSSNLGTINTTSTTAYALNKSLTITNVYGYDGLLVETSVDSQTNGRHTATTGLFWLTGSTTIATKTSGVTANARWNAKLSTNGTSTTRASTTAYGVFGSTCTMSTSSNGTATITMYARYNSTYTGTMNGNYTARVYGFNIANLIGG